MKQATNSLVARIKKMSFPLGLTSAFVLSAALLLSHNPIHASTTAASVSIPDNQATTSLEALDQAVENVASRVTPAVVNVSVTSKAHQDDSDSEDGAGAQGALPPGLPPGLEQFFNHGQHQGPQIEHGIGSGIIISPDGYIVTNGHVVEGATQIRVTLHDRRILTGKVIGVDKLTDLAVVKVNATDLPAISWGDSGKLVPGQTVLAFGSPFGYFQFSVTRGIVSAVNRPNPYSDDARKPGSFIQTDAAINPGNSGGPLVNSRGELIGINTFIISNSGSFAGAGFAIPSQIAEAITTQLIQHGTVHHGYLGISMNDVTPENTSFFNLPDARGAIISQVTPDSPAAKAGLKAGDVLRSLNGKPLENGSALQVAVSTMAPGGDIALGIMRDGKVETVTVKVGEFHADTQLAGNGDDQQKHGRLGLTVDEITPEIRQQLGLPGDIKGVAVERVRPASPADDAGLAPGDVILELDRHTITSAEHFATEVHAVPEGKDMLILIWSHGGTTYRVIHPDLSKQNGM